MRRHKKNQNDLGIWVSVIAQLINSHLTMFGVPVIILRVPEQRVGQKKLTQFSVGKKISGSNEGSKTGFMIILVDWRAKTLRLSGVLWSAGAFYILKEK